MSCRSRGTVGWHLAVNFDFQQLERLDDETLVNFYELFAQSLSDPIEDFWSGQVISDVPASRLIDKLFQIKMLVHQKAWSMRVKSEIWPVANFVEAVAEWTSSNPSMAPEVEHALVASTRVIKRL